MDAHGQHPVFYDHGGRRWRFIKLGAAGLVCAIVAAAVYIVPAALSPAPIAGVKAGAPLGPMQTPALLADEINQSNTPLIGQGPLVRVVQIIHKDNTVLAVPVYGSSRGDTRGEALSPAEQQIIGSSDFVIERYGQPGNKQIALTFDDGPDPTWTPKILDELSRYHVQAAFFEIGKQIVKYPAITERVAREGHIVGSHTFNHVNFDMMPRPEANQEINQTQRVIRATTGYSSAYFRVPYAGNDDQSLRDFTRGILEAQKQGYLVTSYGFDSNDWQFSHGARQIMPSFDGSGQVVLLHDGGGDRSRTLPYLAKLITEARAHGYKFVSLDNLYGHPQPLFEPTGVSIADKASLYGASAYLSWPHSFASHLFFLTVGIILLGMILNLCLAYINVRRTTYRRRTRYYQPLASVVVPAHNEEAVLAKSVSSLLGSYYRRLEIIIVDDGSTDETFRIARQIERRSPRVRAFTQEKGGKATALNHGIRRAAGEIVIGIDADTILEPKAVGKLVRHFADPQVGAVAGAVRVGNVDNMLAKWQLIDYSIGIYIERNAQALLGAIAIVPGACGAWRKSALEKVRGYSASTFAEDFDLTLAIHYEGYKVLQDNEAVALTEVPVNIRGLFRQRYRWIFGDIQTFWKYRSMLFNRHRSWLGMYSLPLSLYSIVAPLIFGPLLLVLELENIITGNYGIVLLFLGITILMQFVVATIALLFAHEKLRYLVAVPLTRILYGPIRSFILYRSIMRALKGASGDWGKLQRTGTVRYAYQAASVSGPTQEVVDTGGDISSHYQQRQ